MGLLSSAPFLKGRSGEKIDIFFTGDLSDVEPSDQLRHLRDQGRVLGECGFCLPSFSLFLPLFLSFSRSFSLCLSVLLSLVLPLCLFLCLSVCLSVSLSLSLSLSLSITSVLSITISSSGPSSQILFLSSHRRALDAHWRTVSRGEDAKLSVNIWRKDEG